MLKMLQLAMGEIWSEIVGNMFSITDAKNVTFNLRSNLSHGQL